MAAAEDFTVEINHYAVPEITATSPVHEKRSSIFTPAMEKRSNTMLGIYQECNTGIEGGLFSTSWSPDNKLIAASTADNRVVLVRPNGDIEKILRTPDSQEIPITAVRWRPTSKLLKTEQVLVTGGTNGHIDYWHAPTGKKICRITEEDNEIYSLDYRQDGQKLATGGKDMCVRVYDEATKKEEVKFEQGVLHERGHSNRIFAVKFHPTDSNLLYSASWDRTIMCWDKRAKHAACSIFGPYICGDSLCIQNDKIITGSWRKEDPIEVWDIGTQLKMKTIDWKACPMVYCMKPHPQIPGIFAVAGTGNNILRIFDINSDFRTEPAYLTDQTGIYSLDFDTTGEFVTFCGGSQHLSILRVNIPYETPEENDDHLNV